MRLIGKIGPKRPKCPNQGSRIKADADRTEGKYSYLLQTEAVIDMGRSTKPHGTIPRKAARPAPIEVRLGEPEPDTLRVFGGSKSDRFNTLLIDSMIKTGWFRPGMSDEDRARQIFVAVTGLQAFRPADEIEAMLAAQAMAAHHASMECSRRAMLPDQPFEAFQGLRKAAANASRTFIELLSALDRKRGKGGQQVVRVEHVHVHSGGKAIVGSVAQGPGGEGGVAGETAEEPRTSPPRLAHDAAIGAVLPPLRSAGAEREFVPVSCDAEREVPDARRKQHRANDGRN